MTAEYAALEARVAELEQQARQMLSAKIDAVSYGLSLVHADTKQIRETQDIHTATPPRLETRLDRQEAGLARQENALMRLETKLVRQETALERLGTRLNKQESKLDRHGELLSEILRRLPEPPPA